MTKTHGAMSFEAKVKDLESKVAMINRNTTLIDIENYQFDLQLLYKAINDKIQGLDEKLLKLTKNTQKQSAQKHKK